MVGIIKPSRKCHTFLNITDFLVWIQNFNRVAVLLCWIKNQVVSWTFFKCKQARFKSSINRCTCFIKAQFSIMFNF